MRQERVEEIIRATIQNLPWKFRKRLENTEIVIKDYPENEAKELRHKKLLGLFSGIPLKEKSIFSTQLIPNTIVIYMQNIENLGGSEKHKEKMLRTVLLHEIGHYFGLTDKELKNIGF